MKTISIVILLVLAAGIIGLHMLSTSESHYNRFSNYEEAEQSELISKGWIPPFIPKSSYNIEERHRVDHPYIYVALNVDPSEITAFERSCSFITTNNYKCDNSGYPVSVVISDGNHAVIRSITNGT